MDHLAGIKTGDAVEGSTLDRVFADERAFREWYDGAMPRVFGYVYQRCGRRRDLAEELTQQVFTEAVRSRSTQSGGDDVAWLVGIARHRLSDHFRRLERQERGLARLWSRAPDAVTWIGDPADADVGSALAALPASQRAALVFRYVDDLPVRDVARLMHRTESSVESLLSRGRDSLRRHLGADR